MQALNDLILRLYHRLPPPARSMAASLRGLYLSAWRYGPDTERLIAAAFEREHWSADKWNAWQQERLAYVLRRAATQVPYYREQWTARRCRGDRASWEELANWPVLEKEPLRRHPAAFIADDCDRRRMYHEHTSGTSGKSISLWYTRQTDRNWYALFEARWRRWYGVSRSDRWAILGGQLVTPVRQKRPPFWVWNGPMKQLYMSSYHLAPDLIPYYLDALARYRVTYLRGYTSSLFALAHEALRRKKRDLNMKVVITNAEPVFDYQRQVITEAFACPVRETYGMSEMVAAASECEHNRLHLWPEAGWLEILDGDQPVPNGTVGDFVCTGFMNADMPLIRYRVHDRGARSAENSCPCGRTLPLLARLEGRMDDVLYTSDGRQIGRLDPVFKADLPIREAQIVQETLNRVRVRYVPADNFTPLAGRSLVERLQDRMGAVEVLLEPVAVVPRGPNAKFRAVICQIPPQERP
jgi:phenylacetate-coenzyme A ligase PaaK-like adenylate-forming protein